VVQPDGRAGDAAGERVRKDQSPHRSHHRSLAPAVVRLPVDVRDSALWVSPQHGGVGHVDGDRSCQASPKSSGNAVNAQITVTLSPMTTSAQIGATKIMNTESDAMMNAHMSPSV
jgi:hypothetical protein